MYPQKLILSRNYRPKITVSPERDPDLIRPRTWRADVQLPVLSDAQVQANGKAIAKAGNEREGPRAPLPTESSQARRAIKTLGWELGWATGGDDEKCDNENNARHTHLQLHLHLKSPSTSLTTFTSNPDTKWGLSHRRRPAAMWSYIEAIRGT